MGSGASVVQTQESESAEHIGKKKAEIELSTQGLPLKQSVKPLKILLIGDSRVGKTAIFLRYVKNQYYSAYWPTMEAQIETVVRKVNVPSAELVTLHLWDVPGDEDIDLFHHYCEDVDAVIVVADLTRPDTIEAVAGWKQRILDNFSASEQEASVAVAPEGESGSAHALSEQERIEDLEDRKQQIVFILFGTKADLIEDIDLFEKLNDQAKEEPEEKDEHETSDVIEDSVVTDNTPGRKKQDPKSNGPARKKKKVPTATLR